MINQVVSEVSIGFYSTRGKVSKVQAQRMYDDILDRITKQGLHCAPRDYDCELRAADDYDDEGNPACRYIFYTYYALIHDMDVKYAIAEIIEDVLADNGYEPYDQDFPDFSEDTGEDFEW